MALELKLSFDLVPCSDTSAELQRGRLRITFRNSDLGAAGRDTGDR